jgi:glycerol-3-phosphate acyltransferase PlsY
MWFSVLIAVLTGYFLGNLNGAVCISAMMNDDVRSHGSGNAGLTNFIRNYGVGQAVYVILIDGGKAVLACVTGGLLLQSYVGFTGGAAIGGTAVILGHIFPVLLGFRGGKGILSGFFIALTVDWRIGLMILGVFAVVYLLTKYVSLGSILGALTFSAAFALLHYDDPLVIACGVFMGLLTVYMHRGNIVRLLKGQERKTDLFSKGKK